MPHIISACKNLTLCMSAQTRWYAGCVICQVIGSMTQFVAWLRSSQTVVLPSLWHPRPQQPRTVNTDLVECQKANYYMYIDYAMYRKMKDIWFIM